MSYIIVLQTKDHLYRVPAQAGETVLVGNGKKDRIAIEEVGDGKLQLEVSGSSLLVSGRKLPGLRKCSVPIDAEKSVCVCDDPHITVRWTRDIGSFSQAIPLTYDCQVHIGRSPKNDVVIADSFVSGTHLLIQSRNGNITAEDLNSRNGTWLNGRKIKKASLHSGDVLDILYIRIRLKNYALYFENVGSKLTLCDQSKAEAAPAGRTQGESEPHPTYHRSPRVRNLLPSEDITLSHVPQKSKGFFGRKASLIPLISSGAMMGGSLLMGAFSPAMLAMRGAMMISPLGHVLAGKSKKEQERIREQEKQFRQKYGDYIMAEKAHIESIGDEQRRIINEENPSTKECLQILRDRARFLYERRASDSDFLQIRMGQGYEPLCVNVKPPADLSEFHAYRDELEELANQIIEETKLVDDVAARADLMRYCSVGVIGDRSKVTHLVQNMLISLTTLHYSKDVTIVGVFDPEEEELWQSVRWLPHIWDKDKQTRFLNFDSAESTGYEEFVVLLADLISMRSEKTIRDQYRNGGSPMPHYVFLFGSRKKTEHLEIMKALSANDPLLGITTLYLYDTHEQLPHTCQYIIDVDDNYDANMATAYPTDAGNRRTWFVMDEPTDAKSFDWFCRMQSAIEVDEIAESGEIPSSLTFLECLGVDSPKEIPILDNWKNNSSANGLSVPLAKQEGGKTFYMNVPGGVQKSHGLVAGTTGSGKSEFLLSWILSIACHYPPNEVSFVIIDYKGGSMARAVESLPHTAGIITDIAEGIQRCLLSLNHEMDRRKKIFDKSGVSDIVAYKKGYHNGQFREPLPHLLIVIDEFKELKKDRPELMQMIDSAASVGRTLGINLILATQSPEDSVDESVWKNTSYQVCLKVQSGAASKAMIKEPQAAMIRQPGRAYVRIGTSEIAEVFQLVQTAYSGAPYTEGGGKGGYQIRLVRTNGERIKTVEDNRTRYQSEKTEIQAVCDEICRVAAENGIQKTASLWCPELPSLFCLSQSDQGGGFNGTEWEDTSLPWLRIPIGRYDLPQEQKQGTFYLNPVSVGHYGIFSAPAKGKSTLLKTIVASAAACYRPKDINFYIVDHGGWSLSIMKDIPHVGGIVLDGEDEKFNKLMHMLTNALEERRKIFLQAGVDSLKSYRETISDNFPAIMLLIDNFASVLEQYPESENDFLRIIKQGITAGIYLVYTGINQSGIKYKLYSSVSGAIALELGDKSEYSGLVGSVIGITLPNRPGRALAKQKSGVLDVQIAMFAEGENDVERNAIMRERAGIMRKAWKGIFPATIPVMPDLVTKELLLPFYQTRECLPVGIATDTIEPVYLDFSEQNTAVITGGIGAGKGELLRTFAELMKQGYPESEIYLFSENDGIQESFSAIGEVCRIGSDSTGSIIDHLISELALRKEEKGGSSNPAEWLSSKKQIILLIHNLPEYIHRADEDEQVKLDRILRLSRGLGFLSVATIRSGEINRLNNTDQIARDYIASQAAIALSENAAHYETCYRHGMNAADRMAEIKKGYGILYQGGTGHRIRVAEEGA